MSGRIFAKKVKYDGYTFDSDLEYQRYLFLKEKLNKGEINLLKIHPIYKLQDEYTNYDGKEIRAINYEADFCYIDNNTKKLVIEDVKGFETEEFKLHRKLFDYHFRYSLSLQVLKYSKTTGWQKIEDYKKVMKSKRKQLIDEKNYYKNLVLKQQKEEKAKQKEIARIKELESLSKLTSQQKKRLLQLKEKHNI